MGALDAATEKNWKTVKKTQGNGGSGSYNDSPITKNGYDKSEVVSALQKAIRRGHEAEAMYWGSELMDSGHAYHMWRRMVVIAAEDVGLADPDMTAKIMTMKQAHDFARESNIPFQAIMMLCRAPKNREADDASYLYDLKRKAGWKIPVPPEAVDGHTRRGRTNLYRMADRSGESWSTLWNKEFYFDVGLLDKYVEIETDGEPEKYRKALMEFLGLPFHTYDIHTATLPRITSGRSQHGDALGSGKQRSGGVTIRQGANKKTGEEDPNKLECQSFTDPEVYYELTIEKSQGQLLVLDCSCPAFANSGGANCKHMMAVMRTGGPTK